MASNLFKVRLGLNLGSQASDPAGGAEGDFYTNSSTNDVKVYIGGAWRKAVFDDKTQTLTNKNLSDSTTFIVDVSDATKRIKFDAAGTTGTTTTLTGSQTTDRTLTLPDATDTLVGRATTDTLTNKTLTTPVINEINTSTDTNLHLNPNGTGKVVTDNLALSGNTIESTNTNGDLNATANGTGKFKVESGSGKGVDVQSAGHMPIGASVGANDLTLGGGTSTVKVPGALQVTGTIAGNVTGNLTGNASGTAANVTGTVAIANGGTGQTAKAAAFDALAPTTTSGDISYHNGTNNVRLAKGSDGQFLSLASGVPVWASQSSSPTQAYEISNLGLSATVATNALTIALKQSDGSSDPASGSGAVKIGFRATTATGGGYNQRSVTSALSLVVSSGSTLGTVGATEADLWVYAIDSDGAGTIKLGVSRGKHQDGSLQTTVAEGGAGAADNIHTIYSDAAYTSKPIRLIGKIKVTEAAAGTWATAPTEVVTVPEQINALGMVAVRLTWSALGAVSLTSGSVTDLTWDGNDYEYGANISAGGQTFTAPSSGVYRFNISYVLQAAAGWAAGEFAAASIKKNGVENHRFARVTADSTHSSAMSGTGSTEIYLAAGDTAVVGIYHNNGSSVNLDDDSTYGWMTITKVAG